MAQLNLNNACLSGNFRKKPRLFFTCGNLVELQDQDLRFAGTDHVVG